MVVVLVVVVRAEQNSRPRWSGAATIFFRLARAAKIRSNVLALYDGCLAWVRLAGRGSNSDMDVLKRSVRYRRITVWQFVEILTVYYLSPLWVPAAVKIFKCDYLFH